MRDSGTRWVVQRGGRAALGGANSRTRWAEDVVAPPPSFQALFVRHYAYLRMPCAHSRRPGLVVVALDRAGMTATAYAAAKDDGINVMTVGRHNQCDLYLPDDTLSLRHLAVVLHPRFAGEPTRFRVIDLRSQTGFTDEGGCARQSLEAEGPMFVQVGRHALFCFPVGDGLDEVRWPECAEVAWRGLPVRVYAGKVAARASSGERPPHPDAVHFEPVCAESVRPGVQASWGTGPCRTVLNALPAPQRPCRRIGAASDRLVGSLEIVQPGQSQRIDIGVGAANSGLLLGRYDRCDTNGLHVLQHERISRVHALVLRVAGGVYLMDTASSNGTWLDGKRVRCVRLGDGMKVGLAGTQHGVVWHHDNRRAEWFTCLDTYQTVIERVSKIVPNPE